MTNSGKDTFNKAAGSARNRPTERLFIKVDNYDLAQKEGFIEGVNLKTGEPLKVRLNTVQERLSDRPSAKAQDVESRYTTGTYARETMHKKFQKRAEVMMLDDCVALDDKNSFRTHWATTVSTENTQSVKVILAEAVHLKLQQNHEPGGRDLAYVEVVKPSVPITADNYEEILKKAFAHQDVDGNPNRPIALLDLKIDGKPIFDTVPRLYPATVTDSVYDDRTGGMKNIQVTAPADESVRQLLENDKTVKDGREALNWDYFRAAVAGVAKQPMPDLMSASDVVKKHAARIYELAEKGTLTVNVGSASIYNFGSESAKTYLQNADKKHLTAYNVNQRINEETVRPVSAFTEAMVSLGQYEDGTYYVRDVLSVQPYPVAKPLSQLNLTALKEPEVKYELKINKPNELEKSEVKKDHDNDTSNELRF